MVSGLIGCASLPLPAVPALATAAGFNNLILWEDFQGAGFIDSTNSKALGYRLYPGTFPWKGNALTPTPTTDWSVSNSLLTITDNPNCPNATAGAAGGYEFGSTVYLGASAPRTIGKTIAAGGYFKMRMAFDNTVNSALGWPAWWLQDQNGTLALADNNTSAADFGEVDIIEWQNGNALTNNTPAWHPSSSFSTTPSPKDNLAGITADSNFHTYELVWKTVAQGSGAGSFTWYYDGVAITGSNFTYIASDAFHTHDSGNFIMFLATGPLTKMQIDYMMVCQ